MPQLDGRAAIVTAAAGIGQAVARIFLEEGAQVLVTDAHARRVVEAGLAFDTPHPEDDSLFPSDHLGVMARLEVG